jgi:peptidyl-dipeptidase A
MTARALRLAPLLAGLPLAAALSCQPGPTAGPRLDAGVRVAEATAFAAEADAELRRLWVDLMRKAWAYETDITDAHEAELVKADEAQMAWVTANIPKAARHAKVEGLDPLVQRQLQMITRATNLPAPADPALRRELAGLGAKLSGMYGKGEHCVGEGAARVCRDLGELSNVLAKSADWDENLQAWAGWHSVAEPMAPLYQRYVQLGNEGARGIGFSDMGQLWRNGYDMTPAELEAETERLWQQLKPMYEQLHCYTRGKLQERYGKDRIPDGGLIPAHVTGNMWAQSWENLYPLLEPAPGEPDLDISAAMQAQNWDALRIAKTGEAFFTSMGLDPMPATFWERSQLVKPADKEVVCHASAWDVELNDDQRIKMCIEPSLDDLITIHHELGHNYYNHYYTTLPVVLQAGAHDGFHEGIGDAVALSINPAYLHRLGLVSELSESEGALLNKQMLDALQKIAFLPFGRMIDQWRWDVFSGEVPPERWNEHWWKLRADYQGVGAPGERPAGAFDPGAKYHIPANTPYLRYFLAAVLQFQFHKSMCAAAGHTGPLHTCSVYGSKAAGDRLIQMLQMGASRPWPEALEAMTGTRQMDVGPMLEYFEPLHTWLKAQNAGQTCGWQG